MVLLQPFQGMMYPMQTHFVKKTISILNIISLHDSHQYLVILMEQY